MNSRLIISIAKSLLIARWRQTMVAAIGVTFSITMFITLLSFMGGLNKMLDGLVVNRTPHIRIFNEIKPSEWQPVNLSPEYKGNYNIVRSVKSESSRQEIYNSAAIMKALQEDPRVLGLAPKINAQVFYNDGVVDITGVLYGIDAKEEIKMFHFSEYVTSGNPLDINNLANSVILGKPLAEKLHASIGDIIQVVTIRGDRFPLKLVGIYESGLRDIDKTLGFANIKTTQKILGKENNYITDIQVKLHDINKAPELARSYAARFKTEAEDIQTANSQFETGSFVRTVISYAVGITLLIVAGFGIYNILNMMIYEKMDTIAILKATGFAGKDVKSVFLVIALSIGIAGGLFGLLFGFALSSFIDQVPFKTAALPTITTYPVYYNIKFYIIGMLFSIVTTYLAGLFPARKASRIDPVIIIRGK